MQCFRFMSVTSQPSSESIETHDRMHRLLMFGRRHPILTTLGLAGAGLVGGIEVAVGALFGAGIASIIRRPSADVQSEPVPEPIVEPAPPPPVETEHAKSHGLRDRAIAILHAARGDTNGTPSKQAR
jgi:hypothetical protein